MRTPRRFGTLALALAVCVAASIPFAYSAAQQSAPKKTKVKAQAKAPAVQEAQALEPGRRTPGGKQENDGINPGLARRQDDGGPGQSLRERSPRPVPTERRLRRARSWNGDVRSLPQTAPKSIDERQGSRESPDPAPRFVPGTSAPLDTGTPSVVAGIDPARLAPAPAPLTDFEGLDRFNWGAGSPPDTNGDVGPTYYIQSVNTSVGIYRKSDGFQEAAFTFDTLMSQGSFGNQCDTENFGDPVVLYDTFEDRWILTDFAFTSVSGNIVPPEAFECFAVSKTGDPLTGGWNFYSIKVTDALNDYPKLGVWSDGIYMSSNLFSFTSGGGFQGVRVWALNKAQMYAGNPTVQVVSFDVGGGDFTLVPSNARLQVGTPPAGRPNLFLSSWQFTNALTAYKFHVDWTNVSSSTFTGPDTPLAATSWPNAAVGNAAQLGTANLIDVLQIRAMVQNQYTNFGGVESLWLTHTVRRGNTTGLAAPRWYQVDVTGGTVAPNLPQAATWDPDGANVMNRFMPSLALDRDGNLALGYSTSNSSTVPAIKYAGRLAGDPLNTFSQTEQTLFAGLASQTLSTRWGDYSSMTLDPDGCTFWYTNQYGNTDQSFNNRWRTRISSFRYPSCIPAPGAAGSVSGTVVATTGGAPIVGAAVQFGSRSTTTDGSGQYSFANIPAGTHPSISASFPGYVTQTATDIVVTDGNTTIQDFSLASAPLAACFTDTSQADFQSAVRTNVDIATSPGDVVLQNAPSLATSHTLGTSTGTFFDTPPGVNGWGGQTFIPTLSGALSKADVQLFCSGGCTGTPNITVSIRATSAGLPTGPDLATATIPGFSSGASAYYSVVFGSPATVVSGTQYALILRPATNPSAGSYAWIRANPGTYANGQRVSSADLGATWIADSARDFNFKTYVSTGYSPSGTLVSSTKDANPIAGASVSWGALSWTATTPVGTDVMFQAAASNSAGGPFNFVGPDSTAATFFTNGGSLAQFNGKRYLKYRASLSTSNSAVTPTLQDVTVCFQVNNVRITAGPGTQVEGTSGMATPFAFTVTRSPGVSGVTTNVTYTLTGTATAPDDYNALSGSLNLTDVAPSKTITVLIRKDTKFEPNETLILTLTGANNGYGVARPACGGCETATVVNDDVQPAVRVNLAASTEGPGATATVTVTLSNKSYLPVSVNAFTANGSAFAPGDYTTTVMNGFVVPADSISATFLVPITDDAVAETTENFLVQIVSPVNATLGSPSASVGNIYDNDVPLAPAGDSVLLTEGKSGIGTLPLGGKDGGAIPAGSARPPIALAFTAGPALREASPPRF